MEQLPPRSAPEAPRIERFINYAVLGSGYRIERVPYGWADAAAQSEVIDRALRPIVAGEPCGWVFDRGGNYSVTGEISSRRAVLTLRDGDAPVAVIAVCVGSRGSVVFWDRLRIDPSAPSPIDPRPAPRPPWCALRSEVPLATLPAWIHGWAKTVGVALTLRDRW